MEISQTQDLADVAYWQRIGGSVELFLLIIVDLVDLIVLELEKSQKIVRYGFKVTLWRCKQVVSHSIVCQLSYFSFELLSESWRIFAQTICNVNEGWINLIDIQNCKNPFILNQNFVNVFANHSHCGLYALKMDDIMRGTRAETDQ